MKHRETGSILLSYLKSRFPFILYHTIFSTAVVLFNCLYIQPLKAAVYPVLLGTIIGFFMGLLDFKSYSNDFKKLKNNDTYTIESLPSTKNLIDQEYQQMIYRLEVEREHIMNEAEARLKNSNEYYTIWAHQIKTPISSLRLLLQHHSSESIPHSLHTALVLEAIRIEEYVDMVLQYERLWSTNAKPDFQEHSIDSLVIHAVRTYASLFIHSNVKLEIAPLCGTIITDEKWFVFVIEQLLSNAIKYSLDGSIKVSVEDDHSLVIQDQGIGIQKQDLPHIFERGFVSSNQQNNGISKGIGLYLCQQILSRLDLYITVESTVDVGTTVSILLPHPATKLE